MAPKVVILGGSYAGINALKALKKVAVDATVVAPSSKFFLNMAAPRLLVDPELMGKALWDIDPIVSGHGGKFVHDAAESVDFNAQKVVLAGGKTLNYDKLVIATGAVACNQNGTFKLRGDYKDSVNDLHELNHNVRDAQRIVVAGAGPTGVETAAELKYAFPNKTIELYTGAKYPLGVVGEALAKVTATKLDTLGVKVINNKRLDSVEADGAIIDGEKVPADLVIPTTGVTPNTSFLSHELLDRGFIKTDDNLRVSGVSNAYAFGDVVAKGNHSVADLFMAQEPVLRSTMAYDIDGKGKLKSYQQPKPAIVAPLGKDHGVGMVGGRQMPEFFVKFIKGKDYLLSKGKYMI